MTAAPTAGRGASSPRRQSGVLEPFSRRRQFHAPICRELATSPEHLDMARAIGNCSTKLAVLVALNEGQEPTAYLRGTRLCNQRLCPFCEWRRTSAWRARLYKGLTAYGEAYPKHRGLFLTLTVRNCPLDALRETVQQMNRAWNRFTRGSWFPSDAWFRRTEVTVGHAQPGGPLTAHPHFHALLLVRPSFFGPNYIKQLEWQRQWQMAARLDYAPVVDVRAAKKRKGSGGSEQDATSSAVLEAAKYAAKATDLLELGPALTEYADQVKGLRMYALSRKLSQFVRSGDLTEEELLDDVAYMPEAAEVLHGKAMWFEDLQQYLFTSL